MSNARIVLPRRPPRLSLFDNVVPFYFVTFNTHNRAPILASHEVHQAFRGFCQKADQDHGIAVGRYVIMPDHVHLFVSFPAYGPALERWISGLRTVIGKELLRLGIQKPHWQEGFFDHVLRNAESYSQKWEYVRMNPVRAGLCRLCNEWPSQGEIVALPFD